MAARHHAGALPFEKAGGFAPTIGIIGTVMGLVHVLQNLSAPATLGPSISAAFIATLMGVGSANVLYLPVANRLKALSAEEIELRTLTLEGILSVQAGDNPRVVEDKLTSYVAPSERKSADGGENVAAMPGAREGSRLIMARRKGHAVEAENEERWLLTYADMLTLLFALFMVLFSISSVNISKYQVLQQSLKAAFSGSILPGGRAILNAGTQSTSAHTPATAEIPSIVPLSPTAAARSNTSMTSSQLQAALDSMAKSVSEQNEFAHLKNELNAYARSHGFANQVQAEITRRGLVVNVLTDKLLFVSGSATVQPAGLPLLTEIAHLLNVDTSHPIVVEGHTDNIPIATAEFPSNWELSTTRATNVLQYLITQGVSAQRSPPPATPTWTRSPATPPLGDVRSTGAWTSCSSDSTPYPLLTPAPNQDSTS